MCIMEEITCQISFIPIGVKDYSNYIDMVLTMIKKSGLKYQINEMSTFIKGGRNEIFEFLKSICMEMSNRVKFTLDVKLSNVCGC